MHGPRYRPRGEARLPQAAQQLGELALAQRERRLAELGGPALEAREIPRVGGEGVGREAPLDPQVVEILPDGGVATLDPSTAGVRVCSSTAAPPVFDFRPAYRLSSTPNVIPLIRNFTKSRLSSPSIAILRQPIWPAKRSERWRRPETSNSQ